MVSALSDTAAADDSSGADSIQIAGTLAGPLQIHAVVLVVGASHGALLAGARHFARQSRPGHTGIRDALCNRAPDRKRSGRAETSAAVLPRLRRARMRSRNSLSMPAGSAGRLRPHGQGHLDTGRIGPV